MRISHLRKYAFAAVFSLCSIPVFAQTAPAGCRLEVVEGSGRHILHCPEGLTVTAEAGARFELLDRNGDKVLDTVRLRDKAVLVDVPRGRIGSGFQVVTPQAIAAVRGTRWAVDVKDGATAVFVVRGRVSVRRPQSAASVVLDPGEGVNVGVGAAPLAVHRWSAQTAAALLARLGE